jgi:hypothetical protein
VNHIIIDFKAEANDIIMILNEYTMSQTTIYFSCYDCNTVLVPDCRTKKRNNSVKSIVMGCVYSWTMSAFLF